MPSDAVTFFAAFAAVFAGIAAFLWHLEKRAHGLEERLSALQAEAAKGKKGSDPGRQP